MDKHRIEEDEVEDYHIKEATTIEEVEEEDIGPMEVYKRNQ